MEKSFRHSQTRPSSQRLHACHGAGARRQPTRRRHSERLLRQRTLCITHTAATTAADGGAVPESRAEGATFNQAVFSVLNILMGVGLLSVPLALSKSGYAGVLVLWLLAVVTNYTGKALCRCAKTVTTRRALPKGQMVRYEDIADEAFGTLGRRLVATIMYTELVGTCALLLILESDNLWNLIGPTLSSGAAPALGGLSSAIASPEGVFWLAVALVVPTVCAPNVKSLSFLGLCGFVATLTVTSAVAFLLFSGSFPAAAATTLIDWGNLPLIFGIMAFSYAGHSVFPSIQASMRRPSRFPRVLDTAYCIVAALCTFLGVAGYYMYGDGARDVITFNMRAGWLKTLCASMILINPLAKFALTMEPVALNVRAAVTRLGHLPSGYLTRTLINLVMAAGITFLARFLPYLSVVMSLVGAFMTIFISIILPAAASLRLHHEEMGGAEQAWAAFVIAVGVCCAASGTAAALLALKAKLGVVAA